LEQHLRLNDFCWIGHNRHGTIGRNIKTNAHPFEILDEDGGCLVVGAHNGTLKNKHVLEDHALFGTDSEALFYNIAIHGLEETLPKIEGAWALTYYDHVKETLCVIRNKERTLFFAFEEGKKTIIWASEIWMIRVACSRNGVKLDEDKVYSFDEDTLYTFPAPMKSNDEITYETKGGLVGKELAHFFPGRQNWWDKRRDSGTSGSAHKTLQERKAEAQSRAAFQEVSAKTPVTSSTQSGTQTERPGEKPLSQSNTSSSDQSEDKSGKSHTGTVTQILSARKYKGYKGVLLSKTELMAQLSEGCAWCEDEVIDINDRFAWLEEDKPVCAKCIDGTHVEEVKKVSVH